MTGVYFPYALTEVYCIVFAITIWLRLSSNLGTEHEVHQLRNMIYSYLVMLVTDIIWALTENGTIHIPKLPYAAINAVTIISIACGCYFWFRFIEDRLHFRFADSRLANFLLCLPLLSIVILDLISIFTGWIFYIDEQGHYQSTSVFLIHTTVNYFYLLIPTIYAIQRAYKTHSRQDRGEYMTYAIYMIAPLISGLMEDYFPHVPLLALNIFLMILILFLMIQNKQVYHDALTGLNNRRRLDSYLEELLPSASDSHPILLFIMDINNFKSINDLYGHMEGDNALLCLPRY
jgi:GGDEF domain-containing protein